MKAQSSVFDGDKATAKLNVIHGISLSALPTVPFQSTVAVGAPWPSRAHFGGHIESIGI